MKTLHDWGSLGIYGIHYLTGESDGLGMRALCDVSAEGWALLDEFFSNTHSRNASQLVGRILRDLDDMDMDRALLNEGRISDGGWPGTERAVRLRKNLAALRDNLSDSEFYTITSNNRGTGINTSDYREGSILLPWSLFTDLAVYALLTREPGVVAVLVLPSLPDRGLMGGIYGYNAEDWERWDSEKHMAVWSGDVIKHVSPRIYQKSNQPGNGVRNTHATWGFTET